MKRKAKKRYPDLYQFRSLLFWYPCSKCGKEFRRERGWRALTGPWVNNCGRWRYLCPECAPTREEADEYFLNESWIIPPPTKRPSPPQPQPPRKRIVNKDNMKIISCAEFFKLIQPKEEKKRYNVHIDPTGECDCFIEEDPKGEYIKIKE